MANNLKIKGLAAKFSGIPRFMNYFRSEKESLVDYVHAL
jgi:hypothetical protein